MFRKFLFAFYVTYKKININEKVDFAWGRSFNFVIKEVVILTLLCDHFSKTLELRLWHYLRMLILRNCLIGKALETSEHDILVIYVVARKFIQKRSSTNELGFGPYFPAYGLNTERCRGSIFSPNAGKCVLEKVQIWTLCTQCNALCLLLGL